jgi:F420-non-reducing hydrogenase iron-sulfur subunit
MTKQPIPFEPVIVGFTCNWCSYRAADLAGTARIKYPPNVRLIRLMCSGRLDPTFVLRAFAEGADGVLVTGCHPGECHYLEQNYKTLRRVRLLQRTLQVLGIEPERLRLVWASAAEGVRLAREIERMVDAVRALGPLDWGGQPLPLEAIHPVNDEVEDAAIEEPVGAGGRP